MCAAVNKSSEAKDFFVTLRLPTKLHAAIAALADRNERTTSAEIRLALREHLDRQEKAA